MALLKHRKKKSKVVEDNEINKEVLYEERYNDILLNEINSEKVEDTTNLKTRRKSRFVLKRKSKKSNIDNMNNKEDVSLNRNSADIVWSEDKFLKK